MQTIERKADYLRPTRCIFTDEPVVRHLEEYPGIGYTVALDGETRVIKLAPYNYLEDDWFQYNKHRILKKIRSNDHWHYLGRGLTKDELIDYFVAPPKVL